ncbi:unnamed protein product [Closterium sp. Naga37s-1]|nr:unnamed protein product [Closterium sp. Naga37s-1]
MNGVDSLLQAAAIYKSRDPKTTEEEEMLENIFDALCSVVMVDENKERFVKSEGVELMIITMKQRKLAYSSAMKALDFATKRCPAACERFVDVLGLKTLFSAFMNKNKERFVKSEGVELMIITTRQRKLAYSSAMKALDFATTRCPAACERFVDVLGLKTLFSAFMNKVTVKRKDKSETLQLQQEIDERVISLIASLLCTCHLLSVRVISLIASLLSGLSKGSRRDRVLSKFVEGEYEKIDHLLELYMKYWERVRAEERRQCHSIPPPHSHSTSSHPVSPNGRYWERMTDEDRYLARLEAGLFTLQVRPPPTAGAPSPQVRPPPTAGAPSPHPLQVRALPPLQVRPFLPPTASVPSPHVPIFSPNACLECTAALLPAPVLLPGNTLCPTLLPLTVSPPLPSNHQHPPPPSAPTPVFRPPPLPPPRVVCVTCERPLAGWASPIITAITTISSSLSSSPTSGLQSKYEAHTPPCLFRDVSVLLGVIATTIITVFWVVSPHQLIALILAHLWAAE